MKGRTLERLIAARRDGQLLVRALNLETGDDELIDPATDHTPLGVAAAAAAGEDVGCCTILGGQTWFLMPYHPKSEIVIIGAVHCAQALAALAAAAGFHVRVIDPRSAYATQERFANVVLESAWPDEALAARPLTGRSALVALAHDPKLDDAALAVALRSPALYIGALGSRRTHERRLARLQAQGFSPTDLARIHGPVGLTIGARTPAEIAIAIMAEMIQERRAPVRVAGIVLAAGSSRRMGHNKLIALVDGKPMVRHAVDAALAAGLDPVIVVIGYDTEAVRAALAGAAVRLVQNDDHLEGISKSLRAGIGAVPNNCDGAMVLLGDMPSITLNVLLSFAQFEREVTGERIRDKIAASKKKGIWMGGTLPLGYRVDNRKLVIDPDEAALVKMIFDRYLELGTIRAVIAELNERGVRTRVRQTANGSVGGVRYTTGPLAYLLRNRTYIGEAVHKEKSYPGEHPALLDKSLFDAVQARLADNAQIRRRARDASGAMLTGKIFDDRGNTMTPTYSVKGGLRYRYYVSRVCVEGRKKDRGTVHRVPAHEVESKIIETLRVIETANDTDANDASLAGKIKRVSIERGRIAVELLSSTTGAHASPIHIPWSPKPGKAKREIVLPHEDPTKDQRPIRNEYRDTLLRRVAKGRFWLKELMTGEVATADAIAAREGRSRRSVQMMISLAFVAPDIIEAAARGALPRGIGITRLMDLPPLWSEQRQQLGLKA